MPRDRQRPPFPKSDAILLEQLDELVDDLRSRNSKSRHLLDSAIEAFQQWHSSSMKLDAGTREGQNFQWRLPSKLQNVPLKNAYDALVFYREFFRLYRIPSSLTILDVERLIKLVGGK